MTPDVARDGAAKKVKFRREARFANASCLLCYLLPAAGPTNRNMKVSKYIAAATVTFGVIARGATLVVPVTEDTTLSEIDPNFNLGAVILGAGGINQVSTQTEAPYRMRSLLLFELAGIPTGATITSAELSVTLVNVPPGTLDGPPPGSTFELHRVLKEWGEGNKGGFSPRGAAATTGDATWNFAKHQVAAWSSPGASDPADATTAISSSIFMDGIATYTFPSTGALVADVQSWLDNPATNFGWLMKSDSEPLQESARRFASRENATGKPTLTLTYNAPVPELRIQQFELRPTGMFLAWTGVSPRYRVERADNILGPWTPVTDATTDLQTTAPAGGAMAFYRVASALP